MLSVKKNRKFIDKIDKVMQGALRDEISINVQSEFLGTLIQRKEFR